ncbi:MAG: single-stranded DNA-binding protein [Candidatus Pacebacteria bacterium]|nr:single-stranded DNA-binding protein [Candidatus Paceibacterota bacterium]MDD4074146.1 single-stranded DNA-binding protein [Candidatus Paceibacterota bacterium]
MNLNKVFLIGRIATDIEMKSTPSGQSVCSFSLATSRKWKDKNGQSQEDSQFHRIVLWARLAEIASQFLSKGSLIMIEGRIQNRSWEDKSGNKRYTTEIIGESMQMGPKSSSQGGESKPSPIKSEDEEIPIIEDGDEIDIKDIPF